jgi:hypothetical protein
MDQSEHNPSDTPPPPRSLTERLKAEANGHLPAAEDLTAALMARVAGHSADEPTPSLMARVAGHSADEPTPSFMARRFAPDGVPLPDARRVEVKAPLAAFVAAQPPEARGMRMLIGALILVALVPSAMLGALFWFEMTQAPSGQPPALARQGTAPTAIEQASVTATLAPATTQPKQDAELPAVALTVPPNLAAQAGQEVAFAIALDGTDGLPARSIVTISGLPAGATFSDGRPYGQTEWSLRSDEIGDLTLALPANVAGSSKLGVQLLAADGRIIASAETLLQIAADPKAAGVVHRPEDTAPIADLMAHGNKMVDVGYFPGARAYFQRAAEAGSGEAALALGETYDPSFIARIGAQGIRPEPDQAVVWYERAKELGAAGAEAKLADLKVAAKAAAADADPLPAMLAVPDAAPASGQGAPNVAAPAEATHTGDAGTTTGGGTPAAVAAPGGVSVPGGEPVELVELTGSVNVRESPSPNAATVTVMEIGTKLRAIGRKGGWVQVTDPVTAQTGWVFSRYVTTLAAAGQ